MNIKLPSLTSCASSPHDVHIDNLLKIMKAWKNGLDPTDPTVFGKLDKNTKGFVKLAGLAASGRNRKNTESKDVTEFPEKDPNRSVVYMEGTGFPIPFFTHDADVSPVVEFFANPAVKLISEYQNNLDFDDHKFFFRHEREFSTAVEEAFGFDTLPPHSTHWHYWDNIQTLHDFAFSGIGTYYLTRVDRTKTTDPSMIPSNAFYEINFDSWHEYSVRKGYARYGAIAYFDADQTFLAFWWSEKKKLVTLDDPEFPQANLIFRASLSMVVSVRDHFVMLHWIVSNAGVINAERYLSRLHPLRRLLKPHIFGTAAVNHGAVYMLTPVGGLMHRAFAFDEQSYFQVYQHCCESFRYESLAEHFTRAQLPDKDRENLPFYQDGLRFWGIIERYVGQYIELYYPTDESIQRDAEIQGYWKGYEEYFGTTTTTTAHHQHQQTAGWRLGVLNKANLIKQLTYHIFWVTGGHSYVGFVMEYVSDHYGFPMKVCENAVSTDIQSIFLTLSLVGLTSGKQPMLLEPWDHIWEYVKKEDVSLHARILTNLHTFQQELHLFGQDIDRVNKSRRKHFRVFHPTELQSSVAV